MQIKETDNNYPPRVIQVMPKERIVFIIKHLSHDDFSWEEIVEEIKKQSPDNFDGEWKFNQESWGVITI
jgi:hypothetical protein